MITGKFEIEERDGEAWLKLTEVDNGDGTLEEDLLFMDDIVPLTDTIEYINDDEFYDDPWEDDDDDQLGLDWGD